MPFDHARFFDHFLIMPFDLDVLSKRGVGKDRRRHARFTELSQCKSAYLICIARDPFPRSSPGDGAYFALITFPTSDDKRSIDSHEDVPHRSLTKERQRERPINAVKNKLGVGIIPHIP